MNGCEEPTLLAYMDSELYLAYLATVGVFFATPPGPSQLLMISNSLRYGWKRSTATVIGDLSANCLQMLTAAFGLAILISRSAYTIQIIKWAGVLYLVYIAYKTFTASAVDVSHKVGSGISGRRLCLQGFVTSATNPKAVLFFAALFPQFINPSLAIWPQLILLGATYLAIDGVLLIFWGAGAENALVGLRNNSRLLNRLSGGTMFGAAGLLAFKDADLR
jgi:threonine/homoserine/homoserine lactone efflux protein